MGETDLCTARGERGASEIVRLPVYNIRAVTIMPPRGTGADQKVNRRVKAL